MGRIGDKGSVLLSPGDKGTDLPSFVPWRQENRPLVPDPTHCPLPLLKGRDLQ